MQGHRKATTTALTIATVRALARNFRTWEPARSCRPRWIGSPSSMEAVYPRTEAAADPAAPARVIRVLPDPSFDRPATLPLQRPHERHPPAPAAPAATDDAGSPGGLSYETAASTTTASTRSSAPASGRPPRPRRPWRPTACPSPPAIRGESAYLHRDAGRIPRPRRGGAGHEEPDRRRDAEARPAGASTATSGSTPSRRSSTTWSRPARCRFPSRCTRRSGTRRGSPTRAGRTTWRPGSPRGAGRRAAVWGGGETPTLEGHRQPRHDRPGRLRDRPDPAQVAPHRRRRPRRRRDHLPRQFRRADQRPDALPHDRRPPAATGYLTPIERRPDRTARRCSTPSVIYVQFIAALQAAGVRPALRRPRHRPRLAEADAAGEPFVYRMTDVGDAAAGLRLHPAGRARSTCARRTRRSTWAWASRSTSIRPTSTHCLSLAKRSGLRRVGRRAWCAKQGGRKAVEIEPLGITFEGDTLQVR